MHQGLTIMCTPNCTHNCYLRAYVKNGIVTRCGPTQNYHKGSDVYETAASQLTYADEVLARLEAIPGVESTAVSTVVPFGGGATWWGVTFEGRAQESAAEAPDALYYRVSHDYFESMGIPMVAGRFFTQTDREGDIPVAVVSESFARLHYLDESPLGNRIMLSGPDARWRSLTMFPFGMSWTFENAPQIRPGTSGSNASS